MTTFAKESPKHLPVSAQDIGCRTRAASASIASALPNPSIKITIHMTDINSNALALYEKCASEGSWPDETHNMAVEKFPFPDEYFSHSNANAMAFVLSSDAVNATKETYQIL